MNISGGKRPLFKPSGFRFFLQAPSIRCIRHDVIEGSVHFSKPPMSSKAHDGGIELEHLGVAFRHLTA